MLLALCHANLSHSQEMEQPDQALVIQLIKSRKIPGSSLMGLKLLEEDLSTINLQQANLMNAVLLNVNLQGSDLRQANLQDANFSGSILIGTKFKDADLNGAKNLHQAIYKKCACFPLSWLTWWEYDKSTLDMDQISKYLAEGYTICQTHYSNQELDRLKKFGLKI